jgi:hypothetical protein
MTTTTKGDSLIISFATSNRSRYITLEMMLEGVKMMLVKEIGLDGEFERYFGWMKNRLMSGSLVPEEFDNWVGILDICNYASACVAVRELQQGTNPESTARIVVLASPEQGVMISWTAPVRGVPKTVTWRYNFDRLDRVHLPKAEWPKDWLLVGEAVATFAKQP